MKKKKGFSKKVKVKRKINVKITDSGYNIPKQNKKDDFEKYMNKVFDLNWGKISKVLEGIKNIKGSFAETVLDFMDEGLTLKKAVQKVFNTSAFTPYKIRARENLETALKHFNKENDLKELTGDKKIDYSKMQYIGKNQYEYKGVIVDISNSPRGIVLRSYDEVVNRFA